MSQKNHILSGLNDVIECLELPNGHSLVLDEVKIDHIAEESIDADETKSLAIFTDHVDDFQCLFWICSWVDLMIRQVFIVSWC